jgi:hypothetical protein
VTATIRLGNSASMTQGRSAEFASRVRITVNHRLPNTQGPRPWGQELPTTVGQRLAITLGRRAARRVPWRAGGITGIRDLMPKSVGVRPRRTPGTATRGFADMTITTDMRLQFQRIQNAVQLLCSARLREGNNLATRNLTIVGSGDRFTMIRISLRGLLLIVTLAFANETAIDRAHAGTSFDGAWSVVITTDSGTCDPANRLSIDISDGILQYIGDSAVLIRGRGLMRNRQKWLLRRVGTAGVGNSYKTCII